MLNGIRVVLSRYLCVFFAVSFIGSALTSGPAFKRADATNLSVPHSVLLQTLQVKHAVVSARKLRQTDVHPVDVHPAVEAVGILPRYRIVAHRRLDGTSKPASSTIGWQARAPPIPIIPATL